PDAPMIAMNAPCGAVRFTERTAGAPEKDLDTPRSSMAGAAALCMFIVAALSFGSLVMRSRKELRSIWSCGRHAEKSFDRHGLAGVMCLKVRGVELLSPNLSS